MTTQSDNPQPATVSRSVKLSAKVNRQLDLLRALDLIKGNDTSRNQIIIKAVEEYFERTYNRIADNPRVSDHMKSLMKSLVEPH